MILFTAKLVKILLALVCIFFGVLCLGESRQKTQGERRDWRQSVKCALRVADFRGCGVVIVSVVVFAVVANAVAGMLPSCRDTVTLSALGEKREEASSDEVYLAGYTIDGETFAAGTDMQVVDGKWFWKGETYCWRNEADSRQPEGVTRSVTIAVPVGWDRALNFESSIWRGRVEISANGRTWTVDTFSEENIAVSEPIGRSSTSSLIWNQVRYLATYAALLFVFCGFAGLLTRYMLREKTWAERNAGKILYAAIAIVALLLMEKYANSQSLWNDELGRIFFSSQPIPVVFQNLLRMYDMSPPLFELVAHIWYKIAPFGERWLLLICTIPIAFSSYIMGLSGEALQGIGCGLLMSVLTAFSSTLWGYAAFEFSGYAFMVFFTSLCLYTHIQKTQTSEKCSWHVVYSLSLLGLAMSHYFGMMACVAFFLGDLVLFFQKKIFWKTAFSYLLPGGISAIWLCLVWFTTLQNRAPEEIANWYGIPTMSAVKDLLLFLVGRINFLGFLFLVGIWVVLLLIFQGEKYKSGWAPFYMKFSAITVVGTIVLMYVYGNYINSESTMWQGRYFLFLTPFVTTLIAMTVVYLLDILAGHENTEVMMYRRTTVSVLLSIYVVIHCLSVAPYCGITYQPFRQSADWLYMQSNTIFNNDTLIVFGSGYFGSWQDYYIQRQGRRDPLNVVQQGQVDEAILSNYNRVYLQYSHATVTEDLQALLDRDFDLVNDYTDLQLREYRRII